MTVTKFLRTGSLVILIAIALPASSAMIAPDSQLAGTAAKTEDTRSQQLIQRLEQIRSTDKSKLTRKERKDLRHEVKEIKKEMKAISGGVYLSVGAIIIVILLLILLL